MNGTKTCPSCRGRKTNHNPSDHEDYPCRMCAGIGSVPDVPLNTPQPDPVINNYPAVWPLVMVDMAARDHGGRAKYGTALQPFNGRDALTDAYQEALDLAVYLRTAIFERDGK